MRDRPATRFRPVREAKYPVIVDVYGGPGHQQVIASMRRTCSTNGWRTRDFIVVALTGGARRGAGGTGSALSPGISAACRWTIRSKL